MPVLRRSLCFAVAAAACAAAAQDSARPNAAMSVPAGDPFAAAPDPRPAPAFRAAAPEQTPARTPISRSGVPPEEADRPSAAATLQKGAWTSGTAVLVIAAVGVWLTILLRRKNPAAAGGLPAEAVEVLGRRRLDGRNSVGLVRVGGRVLVLGIGEGGLSTLCEVDDPAEVDRLAGACRTGQGPGFAAMLQGVARPREAGRPRPGGAGLEGAARTPTRRPPEQPPERPPAREMADFPGRRGRLDVTTPG